jgi:hypothetical protein
LAVVPPNTGKKVKCFLSTVVGGVTVVLSKNVGTVNPNFVGLALLFMASMYCENGIITPGKAKMNYHHLGRILAFLVIKSHEISIPNEKLGRNSHYFYHFVITKHDIVAICAPKILNVLSLWPNYPIPM